MPRLWVANAEEALPEDDLFYSRVVASRTSRIFPRFLLGLDPGDCLVAPTEIPEDFCRYVGGLLGLGDREDLLFRVDGRTNPYSLVESLLQDPEAMAALQARVRGGGWALEPFLQTPRIVRLARDLGIPPLGTDPDLVDRGLIQGLNDKAWFKDFARVRGVPTVPGGEAASMSELAEMVRRMAGGHPEVMLRKTGYAGGAGCTHGSGPALLARLPDWYNSGRVLVEPFLDLDSVAGSLALLDASGVRFLGSDRQVVREGSWSGFDFPYPQGTGADRVKDLTLRLADALHRRGARGQLNLDWAFPAEAPESPLVLECNFRHNGFGYVAEFAGKFFGPAWDRMTIHSRENIRTTARGAADLLDRLSGLRLQGEPLLIRAPGARQGAVVTAPPAGGSFSAAVFSEDAAWAREALGLVEEAA